MVDGVAFAEKVLLGLNEVKRLTVHQALSGLDGGIGGDFHPWPDPGQSIPGNSHRLEELFEQISPGVTDCSLFVWTRLMLIRH